LDTPSGVLASLPGETQFPFHWGRLRRKESGEGLDLRYHDLP